MYINAIDSLYLRHFIMYLDFGIFGFYLLELYFFILFSNIYLENDNHICVTIYWDNIRSKISVKVIFAEGATTSQEVIFIEPLQVTAFDLSKVRAVIVPVVHHIAIANIMIITIMIATTTFHNNIVLQSIHNTAIFTPTRHQPTSPNASFPTSTWTMAITFVSRVTIYWDNIR